MCIGEWKRWVWLFIWWSYYNRKVDGAMESSGYSRLQKSCNRDPEQQNQTLHSFPFKTAPKHLPSFVFKSTGFGDQTLLVQDFCNLLWLELSFQVGCHCKKA